MRGGEEKETGRWWWNGVEDDGRGGVVWIEGSRWITLRVRIGGRRRGRAEMGC